MTDGAALPAACRLFELLPRPVRVKHTVLLSAPGEPAAETRKP
jgi:NADPH-dependent ferric siderophore reductase